MLVETSVKGVGHDVKELSKFLLVTCSAETPCKSSVCSKAVSWVQVDSELLNSDRCHFKQ